MQQRQSVRDIRANEEVRTVLLVGAASLQQSRNGPYWRLELRDSTGAVEAKIWSPLSASYTDLSPGQFVEISARAGLFRDQLQLTVEQLRVLDDAERGDLPLGDFMPASARPPADMLAEAENLCRTVLVHEPWRKFALSVLEDPGLRVRLLTAPGAKSIHHAYAGGLLEHMLSVAGLCMRMADHYPELDRQTLLAGSLFHDIGKLEEMSGGLVNDYTDAGRFLGHIAQGLLLLEPFLIRSGLEPELALHFRHLIASHHGELEFGSPRQPVTAEAFALHYADNMDARMAQWRGLFPAADEDESSDSRAMVWSPRQNLLGRSLCRPTRTPAPMQAPMQDGPEGKEPAEQAGRAASAAPSAQENTARQDGPADMAESGTAAPRGGKTAASGRAETDGSAAFPQPAAASPRDRDRQCSLL